MASGKRHYVVNSPIYGYSQTERKKKFAEHFHGSRTTHYNQGRTARFQETANWQRSIGFFENLSRNDQLLEHPDHGSLPVDPVRALSGQLWTVKGTNDSTELLYMSGSMSSKNSAEIAAHQQSPFQAVFADTITKTGDGIFSDAHETQMLNWRDSKNDSKITSGLFPVWQENMKLLPSPVAMRQYYTVLTGVTEEDMAQMDEISEADRSWAEKMKTVMVGSQYAVEGSKYFWSLMRHYIAENTRATKLSGRTTYEDHAHYTNAPFNSMETRVISSATAGSQVRCTSEYNFYSHLYERFSVHCPELMLPSMLLQQASEAVGGDVDVIRMANDNLTLGATLSAPLAASITTTKLFDSARETATGLAKAGQGNMSLSSTYWNEFGSTLARVARQAYGARTGHPTLEELAQSSQARHTLTNILDIMPGAAQVASVLKNAAFSGDYGSLITDSENKRENYPMHAEISFTADHFAQFSDTINEAGLMPDLIDALIAAEEGDTLIKYIAPELRPAQGVVEPVFEAKQGMKLSPTPAEDFAITQTTSIRPYRRTAFDVEKWLYNMLNNKQDTSSMVGRVHLHANALSGEGMTNSLEKQLKSIVALGKIKDLVSNNVRKYSQVLKGEPAYAEAVLYQVKKSRVDRTANMQAERGSEDRTFIQNFWFANSSDITNINFIDTQVHYGATYVYEIYAYNFVIGTKYDLGNSSLKISSDFASAAELNGAIRAQDPRLKTVSWGATTYSQAVWYTPSLKIYRTRLHSEDVLMFDTMPIVPEVQFIPYKGISHQFLMTFNGSVGRRQMPTVKINSDYAAYGPPNPVTGRGTMTETQVVDEQRRFQKHELMPGEDLVYESDDRPEYFEVYRTTTPPYSYADFDGKLTYRVHAKIPSDAETYPRSIMNPKYADSATMKEVVVPNKKYYYTVRQIDVHGNFSNPTPVYCVEMVDQQGMIYPVIEEYRFKDPIPKRNKKYFNKYIKIAPSPQQILINTKNIRSAYDASNGNVQLGVADTNIWGKKYKVRITSTTTGKSADLNINFNQKHNKTITEMEGRPEDDPD